MFRVLSFLLVIVALATGLAWLADRPGALVINWQGYLIETSVFRAVVIFTLLVGAIMLIWSLLRGAFSTPAAIGNFVNRRRQKKGLEALSTGMIAIGAGDQAAATRYALQARKSLPNEPMTQLLRAQAAQLSGDKATSRRIYEAMLNAPDTEQLGLRGLYLEAEREGETEAARHFAERAVALNPKLTWAVDALFAIQCKIKDWTGALETVKTARKNGQMEKGTANRRRAVLLTAQAQSLEENDQERALALATEAHSLAPDLIPAGAIAGRIHASKGSTPRATKIIRKTWSKAPHPDLATAYAYARLGDSPRDRLDRVKKLASGNPYSLEAPIAIATAAIEAKAFDEARAVLEPLKGDRQTKRVCTLMARVEAERQGNKGKVREWLARAVTAPADPAWTTDGIVSNTWQPTSPATGALDAFQWRVPVEVSETSENDLLAQKLEALVALGAPEAMAKEAKEIMQQRESGQQTTAQDAASQPSVATKAAKTPETSASVISAEPIHAEDRARTTPVQTATRTSEAALTNGANSNESDQSEGKTTLDEPAVVVDIANDAPTASNDDPSQTKIFESPRPPDDPGPKKAQAAPRRDPANPYRRVTS